MTKWGRVGHVDVERRPIGRGLAERASPCRPPCPISAVEVEAGRLEGGKAGLGLEVAEVMIDAEASVLLPNTKSSKSRILRARARVNAVCRFV